MASFMGKVPRGGTSFTRRSATDISGNFRPFDFSSVLGVAARPRRKVLAPAVEVDHAHFAIGCPEEEKAELVLLAEFPLGTSSMDVPVLSQNDPVL
jgi:hypothetical protein